MDTLLVCCTLLIAVALIGLVVLSALYDVEVEGRAFGEMSSSEKMNLLMENPKKYIETKKLFDLYRVLHEEEEA